MGDETFKKEAIRYEFNNTTKVIPSSSYLIEHGEVLRDVRLKFVPDIVRNGGRYFR